MRIVVLDIAASKTGAVTILQDFAGYVAGASDPAAEWVFITGVPDILPGAKSIESARELTGKPGLYVILRDDVKRGWGNRLFFELFSGASFIRELRPDIVFSLENTLPHGRLGCRTVLYVHQPLGFQTVKDFSFFRKEERHLAIYQHLISHLIDSSVRRSERVIVQTQWMREAILKKLGVSPDKVYAALPPMPEVPESLKKEDFDPRSFIFPSGPIIYKNHECVIKAALLLNEKGVRDFRVVFTLTKEEAGEKLAELSDRTAGNIEWRGRIEHEKLFSLYQGGTLIFPSYIETFGYPPAEARSVGGLVLASDTPFCREVLSGYGNCRYFDPFSPEELAGLMEEVIKGGLGPEASETGTAPAGSWEEVKRLVLE